MATHNDPRTQAIIDTLATNEQLCAQLLQAFQTQVESTGDGSFARFTQAITEIARDTVKPAAKAHRAANPQTRGGRGGDNSWRAELKEAYSGRGNQWIRVELDDIQPTLDRLEADGNDVTSYTNWVNNAGYGWVRFSGGRIVDGNNVAAFEVRLNGSKQDSTGIYHYIDADVALAITERLPNTPFALRLED